MLAKKYRLPIQSFIKKSGRSFRGHYFLFKIAPNNLAFNRFGIIISKKVDTKSTARNKLKRLMFDAVKEFLVSAKAHADFLIIVSPNIMNLNPEEIKKELKNTIKNYV